MHHKPVDLDQQKNGGVYTISDFVPRELQTMQDRQRLHKLGLAITEFYHLLTMLQNYKILNQTALTKLVKKYDKVCLPLPKLFVRGALTDSLPCPGRRAENASRDT